MKQGCLKLTKVGNSQLSVHADEKVFGLYVPVQTFHVSMTVLETTEDVARVLFAASVGDTAAQKVTESEWQVF